MASDTKELGDWKKYWDENLRSAIPKELEGFLKFAQEQYKKLNQERMEEGQRLKVDMTYTSATDEDPDNMTEAQLELEELVKDKVGDSGEILMLFRAYLKTRG